VMMLLEIRSYNLSTVNHLSAILPRSGSDPLRVMARSRAVVTATWQTTFRELRNVGSRDQRQNQEQILSRAR
jgi:hypothetical protein